MIGMCIEFLLVVIGFWLVCARIDRPSRVVRFGLGVVLISLLLDLAAALVGVSEHSTPAAALGWVMLAIQAFVAIPALLVASIVWICRGDNRPWR
jgi:hypothetical protein